MGISARCLLFLIHSGWIFPALAQPIDARDHLMFPVNPPRKVSPNRMPADRLFAPPRVPYSLPLRQPDKNPQLKISSAELTQDGSGVQELSVSVSRLGSTEFKASDVHVAVYFFEFDETGEIEVTGSKTVSNWTSPPVDWKEGPDEKLVLRCPVPAVDSGRTSAGWVVQVLLEDRLQDVLSSSQEFLSQISTPWVPRVGAWGSPRQMLRHPDESERFLAAYKDFQAAKQAFARGDLIEAKETADKVVEGLTILQKESPAWQAQVVAYRLKTAQTLLAEIDAK